jgi:hypothetical protein
MMAPHRLGILFRIRCKIIRFRSGMTPIWSLQGVLLRVFRSKADKRARRVTVSKTLPSSLTTPGLKQHGGAGDNCSGTGCAAEIQRVGLLWIWLARIERDVTAAGGDIFKAVAQQCGGLGFLRYAALVTTTSLLF